MAAKAKAAKYNHQHRKHNQYQQQRMAASMAKKRNGIGVSGIKATWRQRNRNGMAKRNGSGVA